jgi:hypothetical protein
MGRWLIVTLVLASSCLPFARPAGKNSQSANGIAGQILLGLTCPLVRPGDAKCKDQPYETTMIIKTADGKPLTEFRSDSNGDFRVPLQPGRYRLELPEGGLLTRDFTATGHGEAWSIYAGYHTIRHGHSLTMQCACA